MLPGLAQNPWLVFICLWLYHRAWLCSHIEAWMKWSSVTWHAAFQYMGLCVFSLHMYLILLWWSRECVRNLIIIIKSEVWIINHCLGLGHETMVCAVCLTVFLWLPLCGQLFKYILLKENEYILIQILPKVVGNDKRQNVNSALGTMRLLSKALSRLSDDYKMRHVFS